MILTTYASTLFDLLCCRYITQINLAGCGIKGGLDEILGLPTLQTANFANNKLHGSLPTTISGALESLTLYSNQLTGSLAVIAKAASLTLADMHFNNFTGFLPSLPLGLQYLSIANNNIEGGIPPQWKNAVNLSTIGLAYNRLGGSLDVLTSMPKLKVRYSIQQRC